MMERKLFFLTGDDGNILVAGYLSDGIHLTFDGRKPQEKHSQPLQSWNDLLSIPGISNIHFSDEAEAAGEVQHLYIPPRPEWVTSIGWQGFTKTEAILWTCLMVSYKESPEEWVSQEALESVLSIYRKKPKTLGSTIRNMRPKIKDTKYQILNKYDVGYRIALREDSESES